MYSFKCVSVLEKAELQRQLRAVVARGEEGGRDE